MKAALTLFLVLLTGVITFAQEAEEYVLKTTTGDLYGTLLMPSATKKVPLVIIIGGSGPTDRDGNNPFMKNNSLKMLATELSRQGLATFRFDKRGVAKSKAAGLKEEDLRLNTYVEDVEAWLKLLEKEERFSEFFILGHSEGSLIGMLAAQSISVDGYISVAGLGRPASIALREQLNKQSPQIASMAEPVLSDLEQGQTSDSIPPLLNALLHASVQPYLISWFKYNPCDEIQKLHCPILLVQGTNDLQVTVEDVELLSEAAPKASVEVIRGMNHIFKLTSDDRIKNMQSYHNPDLPIYMELIRAVMQFVNNH